MFIFIYTQKKHIQYESKIKVLYNEKGIIYNSIP